MDGLNCTTIIEFAEPLARRRGFWSLGVIHTFMGYWLFSLLFRVASGEHYRNATPAERRWYGSAFLFIPIFIFSVADFGHSILDKAGPLGIWGFMMSCALVFAALLFVWTRYIPAIVSLILGIVVWGVAIWLSVTGKLI